MATHTYQARKPARSGAGPKPSAFQPRPFGETAAAPSAPLPDLQTQIERAGRFGHNLAHLSVSSADKAPIQRQEKAETPEEREKRLAREADKANLQAMFNVTDEIDPLVGVSPNQVTAQEFDEISELYSRVREGDSHLKLVNKSRTGRTTPITNNAMSNQDFATFKGNAMNDIAKILQTPQGRKVLKSLAAGGKSGSSEFTIGGVSNTFLAGSLSSNHNQASNGTGSGSSVYYDAGKETDLPLGLGPLKTTSDTALFHELVHAYHAGQGKTKPHRDVLDDFDVAGAGTPSWDVGVRREEYATVGLGAYAEDEITDNAYRASHRQLAGTNQALADKYKKRQAYN